MTRNITDAEYYDIESGKTFERLANLFDEDPVGFFEFVSRCRDPSYVVETTDAFDCAKKLGLIRNDGTISQAVIAVVSLHVVGEGLGMRLVGSF